MAGNFLLQHLLISYLLASWTSASPPNIIFIMADDIGWNDVGFHNPKLKTPNMNWLAKEGIELTNHYAQPLCSPSRSALMTGKYPSNNGLSQLVVQDFSKNCLPLEHKILPQHLKELGYTTKYVGKWHLGYCDKGCLPSKRGIDEYRGILSSQTEHFKWEEMGVVHRFVNDSVSLENIGTHHSIQEKSDVREMITAHKGKDSPLFMMISTTAPHTPLQVTQEMLRVHDFLVSDDIETMNRRKYLGLVSAVDDIIGEAIQSLREAELYNNSVVIFTSDNGGASIALQLHGLDVAPGNNYPLRSGKGTLFEGGVKVPTIYLDTRLSKTYSGSKRNFLMHISDWLPTLKQLAGSDQLEAGLDGVSQYENLRGGYSGLQKYCVRSGMLLAMTDYSVNRNESLCGATDAAVRFKDWKLIHGTDTGLAIKDIPTEWVKPAESPELPDLLGDSCLRIDENGNQVARCLFNLEDDPHEQSNLYDLHPEIVGQMMEMINREKSGRVQNVYKLPLDTNNVTSRVYEGHVIPRHDFCHPQTDFPLQAVHPSCQFDISEFTENTEYYSKYTSCSNTFLCRI